MVFWRATDRYVQLLMSCEFLGFAADSRQARWKVASNPSRRRKGTVIPDSGDEEEEEEEEDEDEEAPRTRRKR